VSTKIITEPSVYLVGKQTVSDGELDRFLGDHGVSWESDSEVGGEVLAETAGRVCYMSFAKPRPGGNAAYLEHIKGVGHGCYDAETEVLTASGWKKWPDVVENDRLATIDPETRVIQYQLPSRLVRYQHRGRMYRVESQGVDLLVTPDHKMLACQTTTLGGRSKESYSLITAEELGTKSHAYLKCGTWSGGWWTECPGRDVLALLGFAVGDGYVSGPGAYTVRFHLRRERKIAWLKSVVSRLSGAGFTLQVNEANDNFTVSIPDNRLMRSLFSGIYDAFGEKVIPDGLLLGASFSGLEGLFEGLMQSDGHEGRTGDSFDTTSPTLVGQFQQLCLHIGVAANVCYTYGPEDGAGSYGDKPLTRLSVIRRCLKPEVNKWAGAEGKTTWVDGWEGEVFCAEVPNHTLYVRRNGIPVWSGNSVVEHAVWNFIFTGVSRSLTHELVRHRSGTGFCLAGDVEVYSGSKSKGRFNGIKKSWTMKQLYDMTKTPHGRSRLKLIFVRCFDGNEFVQARLSGVVESGEKDLVRVTLSSGKEIRCSADHLFLTKDGWRPVRDISAGVELGTNGLPSVDIQEDWLRRRYHSENKLLTEIASEVGCSAHTVRKYLRKYGLQKEQGKGMCGRKPHNKGATYCLEYNHSAETKRLLSEQKRGDKNPAWTGDNATAQAGRLRAWRLYAKEPCTVCGNPDGHRHHVDRNTLNNVKENVEFLCASCHQRRHLAEDGFSNRLVVKWEPVLSVVPAGKDMTYDLEVDHPAHNFVADGFVTHNSQLSQRYVDESVAEYVCPADLQAELGAYRDYSDGAKTNEWSEAAQAGQVWTEAVEQAHAAYVKLVEYLDKKAVAQGLQKTEARKYARQAARSVLPNATETKIFFTANARSLRHIIEQRCSKHAEPEIRVLFGKVWEILVAEAPNLFGDYRKAPLPDGTFELTTEFRKV